MTKKTYDFIFALFEWYTQSSSGKEEENAEALRLAWDEVDRLRKDAEAQERGDFPQIRIESMCSPSRNGREVPNQFVVHTDRGAFFQSYKSVIAFVPRGDGKTVLDEKYWDYSTTTGKYRNNFLGEEKRDTERKIKSGEYILADLNKGK